MTLTVLDLEGSELGVAAGLCHVSTRTGGSNAPARVSGMATPCWCGSLLPAPEGATFKFVNLEVSVLQAPDSGIVERDGSVHEDAGNGGGSFWVVDFFGTQQLLGWVLMTRLRAQLCL